MKTIWRKVISRRTKELCGLRVEQVTLVIEAENRADVLARIVLLFHRLNVEVEGLYMVRRRGSETMRISVSIQADREQSRRIEANLYKVVSVRSVKVERARDQLTAGTVGERVRSGCEGITLRRALGPALNPTGKNEDREKVNAGAAT